jgi:hypothetical protein
MNRSRDFRFRSDGSIDIDHYRRAAAEERAKAVRLALDRIGDALAAFVRGAKHALSHRPGLRVGIALPTGR